MKRGFQSIFAFSLIILFMDFTLVLLCAFAFLAGFVDSIVGGGGLVQIPAFFVLYPHLSVPNIISTNRLASAVGTSVAAWNYSRKLKIPWKSVLFAGVGAATMSYLGAMTQSAIPAHVLKPVILLLIIGIAVFTYTQKALGHEEHFRFPPHQMPWIALAIGMVLGFYNGMVGPGTGSLLVFGFVSVLGYSFIGAAPQAKIVNVVADVTSLIYFLIHKHVLFHLALPMMACNVAGSYTGSQMAMLRGNQFVRNVFLVVIFGVIARFAWDIVKFYR